MSRSLSLSFWMLICLALLVPFCSAQSGHQAGGQGQGGQAQANNKQTQGSSTQAPYSSSDDLPTVIRDAAPFPVSTDIATRLIASFGVASTTLSIPSLAKTATTGIPTADEFTALVNGIGPLQSPGTKNWYVTLASTLLQQLGKNCAHGSALLLHFGEWTARSTMKTSVWHFYQIDGNGSTCTLKEKHQGDGKTPEVYVPAHVYFLDLSLFDIGTALPLTIPATALTTTATTPQNLSNLESALSALLGVSTNISSILSTMEARIPLNLPAPSLTTNYELGVAFQEIVPTEPPPYSVNASYFANGTPSSTIGTVSNCYDNTCSYTRAFSIKDREFWDISLGLAIPGPTERLYAASTTSGVTPTSQLTHHTDAYAFVDVFPFAKWRPNDFPIPHLNFGVPITSQPMHRPYAGAAEQISQWLKLPIPISVFAGVVIMKQQVYTDAGTTGLVWDRALKTLVGVEVSITGITSKLSGKGSKSGGGGKSNGGATSSGGAS